MMRPTHLLNRTTFAILVSLLLAPAFAAGQGGTVFDIDLGTLGIEGLQQISPDRVFRPLDMVNTRSGAEGWALGGAFVGNASGIGSVSWNPAGLARLDGSQLTGNLNWIRSSGATTGFPDTFSIPNSPQLSVRRYDVKLKGRARYEMLGAASSKEVLGGRTLAGALSFRRYLELTFPEEVVADMIFGGGGGFPVTLAFDNREEGGVDALAASAAMEIIPDRLLAGVNLNYLDGILRANQQQLVGGVGSLVTGLEKLSFDYRGFSTDLGLQFRHERLGSIGLRYTPKYTVEVTKGRFLSRSLPATGGADVFILHARIAGYDMEVPPLLSVGGWFQITPRLHFAAEYDKQNWEETKIEYREEFVGREADPELPLRDVSNLRFGLEGRYLQYRGNEIPVRVGYRTGPLSMADLDPIDENGDFRPSGQWDGKDAVESSSITFGVGFETKNLRYDFGYEVLDYKFSRFYFDSPRDAFVNPQSVVVDIDRRVTQFRLSATLSL